MIAILKNLPDLPDLALRLVPVVTARRVTLSSRLEGQPFLEVRLTAADVRDLAAALDRVEEDQPTVAVRVAE